MRDRFAPVLLLALLAAALVPAPARAAKPNFDAVGDRAPAAPARARIERLRSDPALRALGAVTATDDRLGVPTFVSTPRVAPGPVALPAAAAARAHVARLAPLYGLAADDAAALPLERLHATGTGSVIARFTDRIS